MKIGSFIIIVGIIVLLFSYANFNYQIPTDITNNNLKIISADPFSNSENLPTIFPYTNSTDIGIELEYKVGSIVPILKNETILLKIKDLNNSQTSIRFPNVSTSIIIDDNVYVIMLKASTQFQGFDKTEYAFSWNVNLTYNVSGVVYYVYLKNITFYGRFASVSVFDIGSFEIHQYVRNWSNVSGWVHITPTPLFLNSGNYVIIYNMSHNINFKGAFIRVDGHLYSFKQYSSTEYYTVVSVASTSVVVLYLQATNSSPQIYETSLFHVLPPAHYYVGMYIGIGVIAAGILISMWRRIADIF